MDAISVIADAGSYIWTSIVTPIMAGINELIVCGSDFDYIEHLLELNNSWLQLFASDT